MGRDCLLLPTGTWMSVSVATMRGLGRWIPEPTASQRDALGYIGYAAPRRVPPRPPRARPASPRTGAPPPPAGSSGGAGGNRPAAPIQAAWRLEAGRGGSVWAPGTLHAIAPKGDRAGARGKSTRWYVPPATGNAAPTLRLATIPRRWGPAMAPPAQPSPPTFRPLPRVHTARSSPRVAGLAGSPVLWIRMQDVQGAPRGRSPRTGKILPS